MSRIDPVIWVMGVVALYFAAWHALTFALGAWRWRKGRVELAAAMAVTVGIAWAPIPLPWRLIAMAAAGGSLVLLLGRTRVPRLMSGPEARKRVEDRRQAGLHLVLLTGGVLFVIPFVWLVTTSLKEDEDISRYPPVWVPRQQVMVPDGGREVGLARLTGSGRIVEEVDERDATWGVRPPHSAGTPLAYIPKSRLVKIKAFNPRWKNYADALNFLPAETLHGALYLWNTVLVTLLNIAGVLLSSSLVAFAFARLRWPGRDLLFIVMLSTMMLPAAVTLIPVFLIYRGLGWVDTLQPLWVRSFFAAPFNVFLLRQFFMTIPNDLEDAAKIDGCSYLRIYWNIMLPLVKPALAAVTILTFMGSWNDFLGPLIYISSPEKMTLAYALRLFQSSHNSEYGMLMAASTLVMLPVLLVFFFAQRYFIEGVTLTGIKG